MVGDLQQKKELNTGCGYMGAHPPRSHKIPSNMSLNTSFLVITTAKVAHKEKRDNKDAVKRTENLGEVQPNNVRG